MAMYFVGLYAATAFTVMSMKKDVAPVVWESKTQEGWCKRYMAHQEHESHKPLLTRTPFQGRIEGWVCVCVGTMRCGRCVSVLRAHLACHPPPPQ